MTKDDQQFKTAIQQGKCSLRSFNFKIVLYYVYQLKHIQLTKHMLYCKQNIYCMYYDTQWNFIHLNKLSHMTDVSPTQNE